MDNIAARLEDVLNPEIIDFKVDAASKEEAIQHLGKLLLRADRIDDVDCFVEDVLMREAVESTNMDIGVAIPHGTSDAIRQNSVAIGRLTHPIEWQAGEQKQKVRVVFLMAVVSENRDHVHLELLSKLAILLLKPEFLEVLFRTDEVQELLDTANTLLQE